MNAMDFYGSLMKIFEEHDGKIREWMNDSSMTIEEFHKRVNKRNELTVEDVRKHLIEFHDGLFGKKTM